MNGRKCEIGMVGVGTMGGNLALNMSDHGFAVAVYDALTEKTRTFAETQAKGRNIEPAYSLDEFAGMLAAPRSIVLLVPAGHPVDAVIETLLPYLGPGDLIVDSGNSHFTDTNRRSSLLERKGFLFLGMGISGGEYGARHGPSLMPGGSRAGYDRIEHILKPVSAQVNGDPCVAFLGTGSAGHYVKMVHNGIEYGLMQLIAETYDLMKRGMGMDSESISAVYDRWDKSELNSYLMEITAQIFHYKEEKGKLLLDFILDRAMQKGTGKWTSSDAMELLVPTPTIDVAVAMRNLSGYLTERKDAGALLGGPGGKIEGDREPFLDSLKKALHASMLLTYAQGMGLLKKAGSAYGYGLDLETVARIWRGGCIIRAAVLEKIRDAYREKPDLPNMLLSPHFAPVMNGLQASLRSVVQAAAGAGIPVPGLMASLAYYDAYRSTWLPANLIEAQRDYFGAHTYERTDLPGFFHTNWLQA